MARKALKNKAAAHPKYSSRKYSRCQKCGRVHATMSKFGLCRLCFRDLAHKGQIPGVKKASW